MYTYKCELIKVIDGDTIDAKISLGFSIYVEKRVRLLGINAWETRTKDLEEKKKGLVAKRFLKELLKNSSELFIVSQKDETGKYGRVLAQLYADNIDVNELLIDSDHAVRYIV